MGAECSGTASRHTTYTWWHSIPSTRVASSSISSTAVSTCGGGVGSRTSAKWSSPSAGVLVSPPSHDKSMDFLHHEVSSQPHKLDDYTTTREFRELTDLTAPWSRLERIVYWILVAPSSKGATSGCPTVSAVGGPCLPSIDAYNSTALACSCASSGTMFSEAGVGLMFLSATAPLSPRRPYLPD
jgi:hypothetical protein